ncbi:MAG: dual specificity protein phosphatase family protein [Deltaproteobacteria bacterium]|nr:dual specificity protein phosphatase family protein [Deltaproteobacteria bacterium]
MSGYQLKWITENIAVGYAPMVQTDLDALKRQGIDAIVNLCGEFCDLHEIQMDAGFDVYYFPVPDECAPDMDAMEAAFDWMDSALSRGSRLLIHCRFGVGRTGTFATAYLMRKGLDMKAATKALKHTRANPTHYCQWKMLRKYKKKLKAST